MTATDVVRLDGVSVRFNGISVLDDVTLSVKEHDFLGIIGPNGGGKTTLLKVILGLIKPTKGKVEILGKSPRRSRSKIGYVPQYSLYDRQFPISVWDVVLMGRNGSVGLFRRYAQTDKERALESLQTVGMTEHRDRQIGKLSGGEQQRVLIARALVTDPKILLLDEPTASVDPAMQTEFYEILDELKHRMAIVLVSHDISAVSVYVDKIACLNRELFYHGAGQIEAEVLEATYKCPVQMIAHGDIPHRVLREH